MVFMVFLEILDAGVRKLNRSIVDGMGIVYRCKDKNLEIPTALRRQNTEHTFTVRGEPANILPQHELYRDLIIIA
jgi:hypothetical protein